MRQLAYIKTIGSGSVGTVDLVRDEATGERFARKTMNKKNEQFHQGSYEREIEVGRRMSGYNGIVASQSCWEDEENAYLLMDHIEGFDLITMINNQDDEPFAEEAAKDIFRQLLQTLLFMEQKGVAHRDLKLDNLMIDRTGQLKVIDFGLCEIQNAERCHESVGSVEYASPERYSGESYDGYLSDVWSAGVVLYTLLFGRFPYTADDCEDLAAGMDVSVIFPSFVKVSQNVKDLIKKMLQRIPDKRISAQDITRHDWLL
eukprot:TRINITY_DN14901_c0_g1_i1.p1 TRINITY_DN14901_c0_g1~~TRINITY_DN14901_c0_g1_i1.p1  ORF type:complete len:259 (+),score=52.25 TRINITY_DN14901_c0_g1_i1:106-882(+)